MPQDDPLKAELIKRSWADPANRPPRDTSALINRAHEDPDNARLMQRMLIEQLIKSFQPQSTLAPDGGFTKNPDGSLRVITDPMALMRDTQEHPELYPPENDDDPDAVDNQDEDEEDRARRLGKDF